MKERCLNNGNKKEASFFPISLSLSNSSRLIFSISFLSDVDSVQFFDELEKVNGVKGEGKTVLHSPFDVKTLRKESLLL